MEATENKRGRPRKFCEEQALLGALDLFLEQGYEATSVDDLTERLGINKPSLYGAFGNKEELFLKALSHYHSYYINFTDELFSKGLPPKETIGKWLQWFISNFKKQGNREGCLIVNSTSLCSEEDNPITKKIRSFHELNERLLTSYFKRCKKDGSLPANTKPEALSQFFNTLIQGMAVIARAQGNTKSLNNIAETALAAWPQE